MKYLFILVLFLMTSSCVVVQFNGITNDYDRLSENQKKKIEKLEDFNDLDKEKIYELTGPQLLSELKKYEKSIVYFFANGCKSDFCIPLSLICNYADDNNFELFLIMSGYSNLKSTTDQNFNAQLFSINADYYNAKKQKEYKALFEKDLSCDKLLADEKYLGNYMVFETDRLVEIKREL